MACTSARELGEYQTPSGYTTTTGPRAQRSRQPALFERIFLFNPRDFSSSENQPRISLPPTDAQQPRGSSEERSLTQTKTWCWKRLMSARIRGSLGPVQQRDAQPPASSPGCYTRLKTALRAPLGPDARTCDAVSLAFNLQQFALHPHCRLRRCCWLPARTLPTTRPQRRDSTRLL